MFATLCVAYFLTLFVMQGRLDAVNAYVSNMQTRTNAPGLDLKRISEGVETLSIISALELPGVLLQERYSLLSLHFLLLLSLHFSVAGVNRTRQVQQPR